MTQLLSGEERHALLATREMRIVKIGCESLAGQKSEFIVMTTLIGPEKHCASSWRISMPVARLRSHAR